MQRIPVLTHRQPRSERHKLETGKEPVWLDWKVTVGSLYPPRWCRRLDHVSELLASSVAAKVFHQAVAEY
jgi:hypothetical protein